MKRSAIILLAMLLFSNSAIVNAAQNTDTLLDTLGDNCIAVVRVNNLSDAMSKLDMYMAGASPIPMSVAMLVNMQLAAITGDPMLNGIDQTGSFAMFLVETGEDELNGALLIPVTSFDEMTKNQNITKLEDGTYLLAAEQSPVGPVMLRSALGGKFALAVLEKQKDTLPLMQKAIEDNTSKKLSARLNAAQAKDAVSAPVWGFANLSLIYEKKGKEVEESIEQSLQAAAPGQGTAGMMQFAAKWYSEMFKTFAKDADSATLAIRPDASLLTVDATLRAKDGSQFAQMLVADPAAGNSYKLANVTDDSFAINAVAKINQPMYTKMNDVMVKIMQDSAQDGISSDLSAKIKSLMSKWMSQMGTDLACSFSYAAGQPPVRFREVIDLKPGASVKALMNDSLDILNLTYEGLGMPMKLSYKPAVETYKNVQIDQLNIIMEADPNQPQMTQAIETMYGKDGLKYYMAQKGNSLLAVMEPNGLDAVKKMIDQPNAGPAKDIKTATDILNGTGYTDFAASINILKLMQGMSEMMQSMGQMQGAQNPFAGMFSGINLQSQSCLVMGGKVADGQMGMRIALPKQHLAEVVTAAMQIQQKMMQQQQQQMEPGMQPQIQPQTEDPMQF